MRQRRETQAPSVRLTIGTPIPPDKENRSKMKRILLAFLLSLPVMSALNLASDPMPAPCLPCPPRPPKPENERARIVIELPYSVRA